MRRHDKREVGLKGHLQDLPTLDIFQIVAFSKKTGYLRLETGFGQGAVVFRDGIVVCAYSWSTLGYLKQIAERRYHGVEDAILQEHIEVSIRELARVREGTFNFQLAESILRELDGIDISVFLAHRGVNPQHLLLELAKEIDEDRRDTAALLSVPGAPETPEGSGPVAAAPEPGGPPLETPPSAGDPGSSSSLGSPGSPGSPGLPFRIAVEAIVIVVDDEPQVARVVSERLQDHGYEVLTADNPVDGAELTRRAIASGERVILIIDLGMPSSTGRNFHGGFELIRILKRIGVEVPVLLMADRLSDAANKRARDLGVSKVAFKPALSKLDPAQYRADLHAFGEMLLQPLGEMLAACRGPREAISEDSELLIDFLTSMSEQLLSPSRSTDVSRMLLRVAARFFERSILFVVKDDLVAGLGGFGLGPTDSDSIAVAQKLSFPLDESGVFTEVVRTKSSRRLGTMGNGLERSIYGGIGRGRCQECYLAPLLNNGEVLAILYGDNAGTGKPLGKLRGLELFIAQASVALENLFLHRKLRHFEFNLHSGEIHREVR